jgi:hypothetical protein
MHYKKTTKYSDRKNLEIFSHRFTDVRKLYRVQIVHHDFATASFQFSLSVFDSARDKIMKFRKL